MITFGGHFSSIVDIRKNPVPGNYGYESARSCLFALIQAHRPQRIHIPNYICTAIPDVIALAGVQSVRYPITAGFRPERPVVLNAGDWVLLVNYFGLTNTAVAEELATLPKSSVVTDCSQAFFEPANDCLATIYSARKFLPVPDGGFISTDTPLPAETSDEEGSVNRSRYLLDRVHSEPELSRQQYLQAEAELERPSLRRLSTFTLRTIETVDLDFIRARRRANFRILQRLAAINQLTLDLGEQVPLCYPLMVDDAERLRAALLERRVFTPKYWPGVTPMNDFERRILEYTVFLPLDHRYTRDQMRYLVGLVTDILDGSTA